MPNVFNGTNGNDTLTGTSDDDFIKGKNGDDIISADGGNDRLVGGGGSDMFIFDGSVGDDVIDDFETGIDTLDLSATQVTAANFASRIVYDAANDTLLIKLGDLDVNGDSDSTVTLFGIDDAELAQLLAGTGVVFNPGGGGCLTGTAGVTDTFTFMPGDGTACIDGFELGAFETAGDGDVLNLTAFSVTRDALINAADGTANALGQLPGTVYGNYTLDFDPDFLANFTNTDTPANEADDLTFTLTDNVTGEVFTLTLNGVDTLAEIDEAFFFHTSN